MGRREPDSVKFRPSVFHTSSSPAGNIGTTRPAAAAAA
jgi:hypothetical protein